ncbi:Transcriptional regulator, AraC family [hydrothermal vent metagenome]|uniref:Transcriptional regulator, AraC family n=1 Tax=hydrothermal vent metagenome TaxID=652676 RepID=A0A3B0TPT2_9ZZZZ
MGDISKKLQPVRGLLNQHVSMQHFDLLRIEPSLDLADFVENYWIITWDLSGKPDYVQQNLPYANLHLVIDPFATSGIFGVHTGVFDYRLCGAGRLIGAKFKAGAFSAFSNLPAVSLQDKHMAIEKVFDVDVAGLQREFLALENLEEASSLIENMLLQKNPKLNANAKNAGELVELISNSPEILSMEHFSDHAGMSVRSLQRLFEKYVGVAPKWVIERYRMLAAVDALNRGKNINLTQLAHDLGYYDSSHFGRVFKELTGAAPSSFVSGG